MDKCKGNLNSYCYCCGHFKGMDQRSEGRLNDELKSLYTSYFDRPFIVDKWYAPNAVCKSCYNNLFDWKRTKGDPADCYACENFVPGGTKKKMEDYVYKAVDSAKLPVDRSVVNIPNKYPPGCTPPDSSDYSDSSDFSSSDSESDLDDMENKDPSFDPGSEDGTPQLITQEGEWKSKTYFFHFKFQNFSRLVSIKCLLFVVTPNRYEYACW